MHHVPIALYILAVPIVPGIAFLLWALSRLERDKKSHGASATRPAKPHRWP